MIKEILTPKFKKVGTSALWLSSAQATVMGTSAVASLLFARLVEPETFGQYQYLLSVFGVLGFLGLSGMPTATTRGVVKERAGVYINALKLIFLISPLSVVLSWVLLKGQVSSMLIVSMWILFVLYHTAALAKALYHGQRRFEKESRLSIVGSLVSFLILAAYLWIFDPKPLVLLFIAIAGPILPWIGPMVTSVKEFSTNIDWFGDKDIRYGLSLSAIDALPTMAAHVDKLVVGLVLSNSNLAVYSFALAIPLMIQSLIKTTIISVVPEIIETNSKKFVYKLLMIGAIVGVMGIVGFWVTSRLIFSVLYPQYMASVPYSKTASLILLGIPGFIAMTYFQVRGERKVLAVLTIISSLLMIGSVFGLTQAFGLWGATWSRVLGRLTMTILAVGYLLWRFRKDPGLK